MSSAVEQSSRRNTTAQFVDNRPTAVAQRQMQQAIAGSARMQHSQATQQLLSGSLRMQQAKTQQTTIDNRPLEKQQPFRAAAAATPAQLKEAPEAATPAAAPASGLAEKNETGLPDELKSSIENLSGFSLSDVSVHYNSAEPAQLQAHAYAQGTDIHLAPGQEKHLPHEAWHVVQQKQGRVKPGRQLKGKGSLNTDVHLEKEADAMGAHAVQLARTNFSSPTEPGADLASADLARNQATAASLADTVQRVAIASLNTINVDALSHFQKSLFYIIRSFVEKKEYVDDLSYKAEGVAKDNPTLAREIRAKRKSVLTAMGLLAKYITEIPDAIFAFTARRDGEATDTQAKLYRDHIIAEISGIQKAIEIAAAPPTRKFDEFKGDADRMDDYYTGDSPANAIPIYWYKQKSDYDSIELTKPDLDDKTEFNFPHGPSLEHGDKEYDLTAEAPDALDIGKVYKNQHKVKDRMVQKNVRAALIAHGFTHTALDGDHIQDLGFGGADKASNIWPLDESINRRPYTGWRGLYGINYKTAEGDGKTGTLASLQNKYFRIKGHMDAGPVPDEGKEPDVTSGTDD